MYYDINPAHLNPAFRTSMCNSWWTSPATMLTHDNVYCGCFFE